ncbi:MAG: hypothetical protein HYY20_02830, partial [Candidatus Tectomicrobia bacterium]|nr:hypothetical protein [Candidatus Tectomicrobia bacterium]
KQRHQTQIGNSYYLLPIQWNEPNSRWVEFGLEDWFNPDGTPKTPGKHKSFERGCVGCHSTGVNVTYNAESGEYVAAPIGGGNLNIGCEACHGPGSDHASGLGDKTKIINPARLSWERRLEVCGRCHNRGDSTATVGGNRYGFPYKEGVGIYRPGEVLSEYFTITSEASWYWGHNPTDGSYVAPKGHRQQYIDQVAGAHRISISPGCSTCHSAHGSPKRRMLKESIGRFADLKVEDNSLCLACHTDRFAREADVIAHTRHPYDPEDHNGTGGTGRCTTCHMPTTAKTAIDYDEHAHTFRALSPQLTLDWGSKGGMINSCAVGCHRKRALEAGTGPGSNDTSLTKWDEQADLDLATYLVNQSAGWFAPPSKKSHAFMVSQGSFVIQWAKKEQGSRNEDSLSLVGFINLGELGGGLQGMKLTLLLGEYRLGPFSLTATGYQSPAGEVPAVSLKIDPRKHTFTLAVKKADLENYLARITKDGPNGPTPIRVALIFGEVVFTENLSWVYQSSKSSGKGSYQFARTGDAPDGLFHVTSARLTPGKTVEGEEGKALALVAQIAQNPPLDPQGNGVHLSLAGYEETVDGRSFKANANRTIFTYTRPTKGADGAPLAKTGIKSVSLNLAQGTATIVTYPLDLAFSGDGDPVILLELESGDWAGVSRLVLPSSGNGWQY